MHTRSNGTVQSAVHDVAEHVRSLARLEAELAGLEVRRKIAAVGSGAVLLTVGGVLGLFALGFFFATAAAALATVLPTWSALLLVGGMLAIGAGIAAGVGISLLRRGVPPVPEQALAEAKLTGEALKGRGGG